MLSYPCLMEHSVYQTELTGFVTGSDPELIVWPSECYFIVC